jgi:hypothetical protein
MHAVSPSQLTFSDNERTQPKPTPPQVEDKIDDAADATKSAYRGAKVGGGCCAVLRCGVLCCVFALDGFGARETRGCVALTPESS